MSPVIVKNTDVWLGMNAKWTLSYWKGGFLWASCYCRRALVTNQLLFEFLRSVHIPNLFYGIICLATAHRRQWDCCTVDILTCPSRKQSRRINACCIPFIGGPANVQVIVPDYTHLCLSSSNKPSSVVKAWALTSRLATGGVPPSRRSRSPGPAGIYVFAGVPLLAFTCAEHFNVWFCLCLYFLFCSHQLYPTVTGRQHFK